MKAFKYFWTSAIILACLFHVGQWNNHNGQAWFKHFAKLGFKTLNSENDQIRKWFQKFFAMTLTESCRRLLGRCGHCRKQHFKRYLS
jgi:hypothetical protein